MGIGCDTGSMPIRILLAFSDSFSHARANSCSAWTLVRCGGVGRAWFREGKSVSQSVRRSIQ